MQRLMVSLATLCLCAAIVGPSRAEDSDFRLRDDFNGRLGLDWKIVRPDTTHFSLTKHEGKLCIQTQKGTLASGEARNVFLLDLPKSPTDFVATTALEGFLPTEMWQQAGIVLLNTDSNHLRYVCEYGNVERPILNVVRQESVDDRRIDNMPVEFEQAKFLLRVVKRGDVYEFFSSDDGEEFVSHGRLEWDASPKRIGLIAKNSHPPAVSDIDAPFDFFEVRSLTPDEAADPNYAAVARLRGPWRLASMRVDGEDVAETPDMRLRISAERMTVVEGESERSDLYDVDATADPPVLSVRLGDRYASTFLHYAYALDGDALTLCLTPKPNAPAPTSLESTEGDGRLLLRFDRVQADEEAPRAE